MSQFCDILVNHVQGQRAVNNTDTYNASGFAKALVNLVDARTHGYRGTPVYDLTLSDAKALESLAYKYGFPAQWLANLINFETGGTFNPAITNSIGATGLIQFLPSTAKGLGTTVSALRQMNFQQQLKWVDKYLSRNFNGIVAKRGLFNKSTQKVNKNFTQADLFMIIFYPVSVGNNNYQFPPNVVKANAGIRTPMDYTNKALTRISTPFRDYPNTIQEGVEYVKRNWIPLAIGVASTVTIAILIIQLTKTKK